MRYEYLAVDKRIFHSKWIPVATACLLLAALFGIPGVVMQFHPDYIAYWQTRLAGIQDGDARLTWRIIHTGSSVLALVCPAVFAAGFVQILWGRAGRGFSVLTWTGQIMGYCLVGVAILIQISVVFHVIRYVVLWITEDTGMYMIYAMVITEGVLLVAVWFAIRLLRRFLASICDTADSMAVTLCCGKLDTVPTPAYTSTGFLLLGIVCLVFGSDRLFNLIVVPDLKQAYYAIAWSDNSVLQMEGISYLFSAAANFVISGYVRRYKHTAERIVADHRLRMLRKEA